MSVKIKMTLLSDTIFGNGVSIPGGEDISVLTDENGFPYYKGSSLKGVFREEAENLLCWIGEGETAENFLDEVLGKSDHNYLTDQEKKKIRFSNFTLSNAVQQRVKQQVGQDKDRILRSFSYLRTFTAIEENGMTKDGSLRECRCLRKGLIFYGTIECEQELEQFVEQVLSCIKWIGTMRTRGFGQIKLERI